MYPSTDRARIILDLSSTSKSHVTGWERYGLSLGAALEDPSLVAQFPDLSIICAKPARSTQSKLTYHANTMADYLYRTRVAAKALGADLWHSPTWPPASMGTTKTVWTIHDDLILGGHPSFAAKGTKAWSKLAKHRLSSTDAVITFTNAVAKFVVRSGISPERVHVISPAAPEITRNTTLPVIYDSTGLAQEIPSQFVLAVGTLERRKNIALAAKAARRVGLALIVVGAVRGVSLESLGSGAYHSRATSDEQLSWLYQHALAFISASHYEGVDLPVFEAMSFALPVAVSKIPVHEELTRGHAHLFSPLSVTDAATALAAAASSPKERLDLLSSWTELAQAHMSLYAGLLR